MHPWKLMGLLILFLVMTVGFACSDDEESYEESEETLIVEPNTPVIDNTSLPSDTPIISGEIDKWALWVNGTQLRGANIHQRRVYLELDGTEFMGTDPVGPPYTQDDFDQLAELGANYVNISHPGLFTEVPPYKLDKDIQDNLDNLLRMVGEADMFAVISIRTGPGRSEFTFYDGDWFDKSYLNDSVWQEQSTQDAWAAMWRYTAERYRDNPMVVGYDLMVEPNANGVFFDVWEPVDFYPEYAGTLYDWNQFYPDITSAIREVDEDTPILVGAISFSAVQWLPELIPTEDHNTVYMVHQYEPYDYTHQEGRLTLTYPGVFDTDFDGTKDEFNRDWLDNQLSIVDTFASDHGVPVAVNEYGPMRWQPGAAAFMDDQISLFEERGLNHALWLWETSWEPLTAESDDFNFRHGSDPDNHVEVESSDLMDVILKYWERNTLRPSNTISEN